MRIRDKSDHFSGKSHTLEEGIINCVQNSKRQRDKYLVVLLSILSFFSGKSDICRTRTEVSLSSEYVTLVGDSYA